MTIEPTTTTYAGGFVYESRQIIFEEGGAPSGTPPDYAYKLQYLPHEEGRVRYNSVTEAEVNAGAEPTYVFDYFIKDHLGNIRMVLTDEGREDKYRVASMEDIVHPENLADPANYIPFYSNADYTTDPGCRVAISTISGNYPVDNTTTPNDYTTMLSGSGRKTGTGILLKVMAGDKFPILAQVC